MILANTESVVHGFLCHAPSTYRSFGTNVVFLSSHQELSITNEQNEMIHVNMNLDSNIFGLGPFHLAIGYGNQIQLYEKNETSFERTNSVISIRDEAKVSCTNISLVNFTNFSYHFIFPLGATPQQ